LRLLKIYVTAEKQKSATTIKKGTTIGSCRIANGSWYDGGTKKSKPMSPTSEKMLRKRYLSGRRLLFIVSSLANMTRLSQYSYNFSVDKK
jgi:hypothetical protein